MFLRGGRASREVALINIGRTALAFIAYGVAFILLHKFAGLWGRGTAFSFWFPAAGLRFAVLWHFGPRWTPAVLLAELAAYCFLDLIGSQPGHSPLDLASAALPPLLYGGVIALCRIRARRSETIQGVGSFPMILGSIAAPLIVAMAELPMAIIRHIKPAVETLPEAVRMVAAFAVGDMTAVLLLAPPLIWLFQGRVPSLRRLTSSGRLMAESAAVLAGAWAMTALAAYAELGLRMVPVMLGVAWVGLRAGRAAAWIAVAMTAAVTLPMTAGVLSEAQRFAAHLALAATALVGNLVGAFSDSELALREQLTRRNRLLFHADRLRTLRAMSTAVIHEIGQPLSIVSIEAGHLSKLAADRRADLGEIAKSAALVEQKVRGLVELVKRLRTFGEMTHRHPSPLNLDEAIRDIIQIAQVETDSRGVVIDVSTEAGLRILAENLEFQQALLNVLRNAIHRTADRHVTFRTARMEDGRVSIEVENRSEPELEHAQGMGIGLLVATSIVEAFGGVLVRQRTDHAYLVRMVFPGFDHD
jgi:signal transduction histidine kinase